MFVAPFRALLDANILFPLSLRDTLQRAAAEGLYQMFWSDRILDEVERNLSSTGRTTVEQARRLRKAMISAFPEAMVSGYEHLIPVMANHEKDRHVAAAARWAGAQVIVTSNLKDFRSLPEDMEARSPGDFLVELFELVRDAMAALIERQASALRKPPMSAADLLAGLSRSVPSFARCVADYRVT